MKLNIIDKKFSATKKAIEVELNKIKSAMKLRAQKELHSDDFYNQNNLTKYVDDDLINSQEAGFMLGYLDA